MTIVGSPEKIRSIFDLSRGVPFGWRLFKGKKAKRFLKWSMRQELRYQAEQRLRKAGSGAN
jgi:hypothetical protein